LILAAGAADVEGKNPTARHLMSTAGVGIAPEAEEVVDDGVRL
jgi:hypothetical protein